MPESDSKTKMRPDVPRFGMGEMCAEEENRAGTEASEAWEAARRALASAVRREAPTATGRPVRRVKVPAPGISLLAWLRAQPAPRGFWRGRSEDYACAFAGVADRFEDPARLFDYLDRHSGAGEDVGAEGASGLAQRYYGGVRFDFGRPAEAPWEGFGRGAFVLPRFELVRQAGGQTMLVAHLTAEDNAEAVAVRAERLAPPAFASEALPALIHRNDDPKHWAWSRGVEEALHAIAEGTLQKVVLARRTTFSFATPLDPVGLLGQLRTLTPKGFQFFFQPKQAGAFLGVSPERLFQQRSRRVRSEAVAGTRPRATATRADAALQRELLQSEKDRREHAFVQRHIRGAFQALCTSFEERKVSPLTLRRGRHLYARFEGQLREGVRPAKVLHALHPTPAVGGAPVGAARRFIRQHEPFDRGWYAAPVGWIGVEGGQPAAELAVGIRSGLVRAGGGRLDLFAGAGIVEGSEADAEWDEVEQKLGNFAAAFSENA